MKANIIVWDQDFCGDSHDTQQEEWYLAYCWISKYAPEYRWMF